MWTKAALHDLIEARLKDVHLIVVANREPYIHSIKSGEISCVRPASGMASALDPVLKACGGTWVAHGAGNADRMTVDKYDRLRVPPEAPAYTLRRVWLKKDDEHGYYHGLANAGLWPLCHVVFQRPIFEPAHWDAYRRVNAQFADAVIQEAGDQPAFVFIQDYHFALLPRMLKERNPNLIVAQFWHIPWPNSETFRAFPWKEELLDGLLGNDLLGFHVRYHGRNFLDTVDRSIEALVDLDREEVTRGGRTTRVRPFPISIDFDAHGEAASSPEVTAAMERWHHRLGLVADSVLGVGIERLDYTKGIPERLRAIDHLLETTPELRERLVFVQIAVPSRSQVKQYQVFDNEVDDLVESINWKWASGSWSPIVYFKEHHGPTDMMALHRLARFCMVTSLHDGMNLVAKEFVASRVDNDGVLILSQFTGAARELQDALLVNPFAIDETAQAIQRAIEMPEDERQRRMQRMRQEVSDNNVYRWAGKIIHALLKIDSPEPL